MVNRRAMPAGPDVDGLGVEIVRHDGYALVRLLGELDAATRPRLEPVSRALASAAVVEVDVSDLHFCDAAGLAALLALRTAVLSPARSFGLVGVSQRLRRVLTVAGLLDLLGPDGRADTARSRPLGARV